MTQLKTKDRRTQGWIERAREQMTKQGLTYDDLSGPLGLATRGGVSHYFNGRRDLSAEQAVAVADRFGCSIEWLLTGSHPQVPVVGLSEETRPLSPDELAKALVQMRPELYEVVARLIAELARTAAHRREGQLDDPIK